MGVLQEWLERFGAIAANPQWKKHMTASSKKLINAWLTALGRVLLRRLETPRKAYEKRIVNNMDHLLRVIRKGDVVLVEGRSRVSRIIQLLTQSSWSHSAFYVGDALAGNEEGKADTPDRRHMLIEADATSGVTAVPLGKYCDENIRVCRPFGIGAQDLESVVAEVIGNLGKRYDHQNILDLALLSLPLFMNPFKKRTIKACLGGCTEYEVICSGMIAKAFQRVGYPIVPALSPYKDTTEDVSRNPYGAKLVMRHYSRIVPRDFDLSPNFDIVKFNIIAMGVFDYRSIWARNGLQE